MGSTDGLCRYANRPVMFIARYLRQRLLAHAAILTAVVAAVCCSVSTQYGVKFLVDTLSKGTQGGALVWLPFALLLALITADNLLWRGASWIANHAFVGVTVDLRRDLFRHLTGHAPDFFTTRLPGTLSSRITATANAVYTVENMMVWNVLPPCLATVFAIGFVLGVSSGMATLLALVAGALVIIMFRLAAAGRPLHHEFAQKAAAVDGEITDVIGNMALVRAFGGFGREQRRLGSTIEREAQARRRSLFYLERVRLLHAGVTVILTVALLAWAIMLWQAGQATTGEVILVCTLGISILHATRDLAVALVEVTQHVARLSEALATLLIPHELRDHPDAQPLLQRGGCVTLENVCFSYPDGTRIFSDFSLRVEPGERVGLIGPSGGGKSTLLALLQRSHDVQQGRILIDGQDIARMTQESLRQAIAVVPQDVQLFHRSILENIRYGCEDATDAEVLSAAHAARCTGFIDALPDGWSTIVGDRGVKLSGGQRQRIAIARAFLKNAPILLMDEATSALDNQSEEIIREALDRLMRGRTVIEIVHRLSTLRAFDRIIVLHAGEIIQEGPPDMLMGGEGLYRQWVEREITKLSRHAA